MPKANHMVSPNQKNQNEHTGSLSNEKVDLIVSQHANDTVGAAASDSGGRICF